jgi:hypothetical protein
MSTFYLSPVCQERDCPIRYLINESKSKPDWPKLLNSWIIRYHQLMQPICRIDQENQRSGVFQFRPLTCNLTQGRKRRLQATVLLGDFKLVIMDQDAAQASIAGEWRYHDLRWRLTLYIAFSFVNWAIRLPKREPATVSRRRSSTHTFTPTWCRRDFTSIGGGSPSSLFFGLRTRFIHDSLGQSKDRTRRFPQETFPFPQTSVSCFLLPRPVLIAIFAESR